MRIPLLLAGVLGVATVASTASTATAADHTDTVRYDRATLRDAPARLVLATALPGDRVVRHVYCGQWVRVTVQPAAGRRLATTTGWVERGSLTRSARSRGLDGIPADCAAPGRDAERWRDFVAAVNSPFRSYRYDPASDRWRYVHDATRVAALTGADCRPSYNYLRDGAAERPDPAQQVPAASVDLSRPKYRYVTRTGAVALVSLPRSGGGGGVWAFVRSACVQPDAPKYTTVHFPRVVRLDRIPVGHPPLTTAQLSRYGCHAAVRSPTHPEYGWWPAPRTAPAC